MAGLASVQAAETLELHPNETISGGERRRMTRKRGGGAYRRAYSLG